MSASGEEAAIVKSAAGDTGEALGSAGGKLSGFTNTTADKVEEGMDRLAQTEGDNVALSTAADPHAPTLPEGDPSPATPTNGPPPEGGAPQIIGPGEGYDTPDGGWLGPKNLYLTPDENAAANEFLGQAAAAEPSITSIVIAARDATPAAELEGYPEFVLKSASSFKEKFAGTLSEIRPRPTAIDEALSTMKDSVRYTLKLPEEGSAYADGARSALDHLQKSGVENVRFKNTWTSDGYKGINTFWRDPQTGHQFEIQFHTQASFEAKTITHQLYDEARLPNVSQSRADELEAEQNRIFGAVHRPVGATDVRLRQG